MTDELGFVTPSVHSTLRLTSITDMGHCARPFDGYQQKVHSFDFSRDGRLIISGSGGNTIQIRDLHHKFHKVLTVSGKNDPRVTSVTFSPDPTLVAAYSLDTIVRIWDVVSGTLLERLQGRKDCVYSVAFISDGEGLGSRVMNQSVKY